MPRQGCFDFADAPPADLPPCDPNIDRADVPRVTGQNAAILALLREKREVPNYELAEIALKYSGRVSDLRKCGYDIRVVRRDGGTRWYRLFEGDL